MHRRCRKSSPVCVTTSDDVSRSAPVKSSRLKVEIVLHVLISTHRQHHRRYMEVFRRPAMWVCLVRQHAVVDKWPSLRYSAIHSLHAACAFSTCIIRLPSLMPSIKITVVVPAMFNHLSVLISESASMPGVSTGRECQQTAP